MFKSKRLQCRNHFNQQTFDKFEGSKKLSLKCFVTTVKSWKLICLKLQGEHKFSKVLNELEVSNSYKYFAHAQNQKKTTCRVLSFTNQKLEFLWDFFKTNFVAARNLSIINVTKHSNNICMCKSNAGSFTSQGHRQSLDSIISWKTKDEDKNASLSSFIINLNQFMICFVL